MNQRNSSARRAGFTLAEMLVVVLIISVLASIVTVNVFRHLARARIESARLQINQLRSAVRQYQMEQGRPPTEEQGLAALVQRPTRPPVPEKYPDEGYLEGRVLPRDPWNHPYIYLAPGRDGAPFEIISYGLDGEPGGEGDNADISSVAL